MELVLWVVVLAVVGAVAVVLARRSKARELQRREAELAPVKKLALEDITALGVELQDLDLDLAGRQLDAGANADYQRALDAYESAKTAGDAHDPARGHPPRHRDPRGRSLRHRVRARPGRRASRCRQRRPPCFFDPRHGLSVADVPWTPAGGAPRDVPACALDVERVRAGAEPDIRKVMVGSRRVPYWQGGPRLPALRRGLLRRLRPDGLDVHGRNDVRRPRCRPRRRWRR